MTPVFRISAPLGGLDRIAMRRALRLVRRGSELWVSDAGGERRGLDRDLALCGIPAAQDADPPSADPAWRPAIGLGLAPLPSENAAFDVITVAPLDVGTATRGLIRTGLFARIARPRSESVRSCRALLRGDEVLLRWERRAWLSPAACADRQVRRVVRPIVFDRAALREVRPGGIVPASAGAISRWAAG